MPGTARTFSFLRSSPKRPHASSPLLEPKAAAVRERTIGGLDRCRMDPGPKQTWILTDESAIDSLFGRSFDSDVQLNEKSSADSVLDRSVEGTPQKPWRIF